MYIHLIVATNIKYMYLSLCRSFSNDAAEELSWRPRARLGSGRSDQTLQRHWKISSQITSS